MLGNQKKKDRNQMIIFEAFWTYVLYIYLFTNDRPQWQQKIKHCYSSAPHIQDRRR